MRIYYFNQGIWLIPHKPNTHGETKTIFPIVILKAESLNGFLGSVTANSGFQYHTDIWIVIPNQLFCIILEKRASSMFVQLMASVAVSEDIPAWISWTSCAETQSLVIKTSGVFGLPWLLSEGCRS